MGKRQVVDDPRAEALQKELISLKGKCTHAKLFKAKQDTPGYPFPMTAHLTLQAPPSAAAFDVTELLLKLTITEGGPTEERANIVIEQSADVPAQVASAVSSSVQATWRQQLAKRREAEGDAPTGWMLTELLDFVTAKYAVLLQLVPECVETYMGCDDTGATLRRYMLVEPPPPPEASPAEADASGSSEGEGEGEGEEMDEEARAFWEEQERRKAEAARQQAIRDAQHAEARRQEVERMRERGIEEHGPRQLSKKEQEELRARKRGQGNRTAKTGPRASKFAGEGSALAKEDETKKKGKGGGAKK